MGTCCSTMGTSTSHPSSSSPPPPAAPTTTAPVGQTLVDALREGVPPSNHWHRLRRYALVVVGSELVGWMAAQPWCGSREQAVAVGQDLVARGLLSHVTKEHGFVDDGFFYRWAADESEDTLNSIERGARDYDLVVIGAGSAGLTAARFAADLGARVALVERHRTGGDCTWTGCVPSKALIKAAKVAHTARHGSHFGVHAEGVKVDMAAVREYVQGTIGDVWQHETPEVLRAEGVTVLAGSAAFVDRHSITVTETVTADGTFGGARPPPVAGAGESKAGEGVDEPPATLTISSHNFLVCTGAAPMVPAVVTDSGVPYITHEHVFDVDVLPEHLVVMGAGPIGCELAQAFRRLGSRVTLIGSRILSREEPGVQEVMEKVFAAEGLEFVKGRPTAVAQGEDGSVVVRVGETEVVGDRLLVATGRRPNADSLNLPAAGVGLDARGAIVVDDNLRTSNHCVYAAGDVTGGHQFTHYAGWQAFQATRNALIPGNAKGKTELLPWTTFTSPEIAHVGLTATEAKAKYGEDVTLVTKANDRIDRNVCDSDTHGYMGVSVLKNGHIVGATVVSERAGDVIAELVLAMQHKLKLRQVAKAIHAYPSYTFGVWDMFGEEGRRRFLASTAGRLVKGLYSH